MAWTKSLKKTSGKVSTAVKKRYGIGKGRGGFKFTQVAKDLEMIKSRLNVEKNYTQNSAEGLLVGQVNGNVFGGTYAADLGNTFIPQGTGQGQRVGLGCKATGLAVHMNFKGMSSVTNARKLRVEIVRANTDLISASALLNEMYEPNPLTGLIDYYSQRRYQSGSQKQFKVLAKKTFVTKDTFGGFGTGVCHGIVPVKLNDLMRFQADGDTQPNDLRYYMFVFCDYGNISSGTAATDPGVLIRTTQTGVEFNWVSRLWYVDN